MNAPVDRAAWQRALESGIKDFNGDAIEVSELLDALIANLKNRYDRDALRDVEHEHEQLKDALEELDTTDWSEQDIQAFLADQDQGYDEEGDWK